LQLPLIIISFRDSVKHSIRVSKVFLLAATSVGLLWIPSTRLRQSSPRKNVILTTWKAWQCISH